MNKVEQYVKKVNTLLKLQNIDDIFTIKTLSIKKYDIFYIYIIEDIYKFRKLSFYKKDNIYNLHIYTEFKNEMNNIINNYNNTKKIHIYNIKQAIIIDINHKNLIQCINQIYLNL